MKEFRKYRLEIGAFFLAMGTLGFPILISLADAITWKNLSFPAFAGLIGIGLMIYDVGEKYRWIRADFHNRFDDFFDEFEEDRLSELREAVSEARSIKSDVLDTIRREASKMSEANQESVERFSRASDAWDGAVQKLEKMVEDAREKMISDREKELIDRAVKGYEERDEEQIIDAIKALREERKN